MSEWIPCSERMPELKHTIAEGGLSSERKCSDPVLITWNDAPDRLPDVCVARCGMKDGDDWGKAQTGEYFWCDDFDLIAIHGRSGPRDSKPPTHWMPCPPLAAATSKPPLPTRDYGLDVTCGPDDSKPGAM